MSLRSAVEGQKGVTLIELIVSIFIIGLFTLVVIPAYGKYSQQIELKGAAEQVKSALLEAQSLALNPRADSVDIWQFKNENGPCYQVDFKNEINPNRGSINISLQNQKSFLPVTITFQSESWVEFCQNGKGAVENSSPAPVNTSSGNEIRIVIHSSKLNQDKRINIIKETGVITIPNL
jgi:prepilin-type N-terminal cleavage/methylation domain-containing protein